MRRLAIRFLDWFIPNTATSERSGIGLARTFVFTTFVGPLLIQTIAIWLFMADPHPGAASRIIITCVALFWTLPFLLKVARNFRAIALVAVQLLCVTSLIGTTYYGGVSSPFLPWLLVSLMLGFFYLPDRAVLLLILFTVNIVTTVVAHLIFSFPQHLDLAAMKPISWFSIFSATVYMSWMAIYYASIVSMASELERETERHRQEAQRLRDEKELTETAMRGKSAFLAKMSDKLRSPLTTVIADSQALLEAARLDPSGAEAEAELEKIHAAGRRLMALVTDVIDLETRDLRPL